ncbi:hypothetical protein CI105_05425 [Candidatus Izimaplasma bacterium ZiA1]|uniref:hypothetical protein n=1 Tax=Candidatus Izimoplasma sp. ZiA1 TaxID=2024899 RepID=UPI000BAA46E0|nr:hypothetical protein CI105_05425 [Candidatus Izimaplasma bacterium ZiA1]
MAFKNNKEEDTIYLYSKKVKIQKLVESFTVIPSFEIVKYLKNKEIYLPNYVHKALVRKNIAPTIAGAENDNKFSDEMKHRLKWFDKFTIFQLEKLAQSYQLKVNVAEYKKDFWDIIVRNRTELGINNLEFVKLQNLTMKYQREQQETYQELKNNFLEVYFEAPGYFDGSLLDEAKEVLEQSTTLGEVRDLGKIYGVEIPRRINKKQLIDILALKLKLDEEKTEEISKKSILELERYAKRRKVNVSIELKKSDMIEYILIKKDNEEIQECYKGSLQIFDGMNIEEYLYNLKFEEISTKVNEAKRKRNKTIQIALAVIVVLSVGGYFLATNL